MGLSPGFPTAVEEVARSRGEAAGPPRGPPQLTEYCFVIDTSVTRGLAADVHVVAAGLRLSDLRR